MNKIVARNVLLLLEHLRKENFLKYLDEIKPYQNLPRNKIIEIQRNKLENLLRFVTTENTFYKNKYSGHDVFSGFDSLPVLTKEELRDNYKKILSNKVRRPIDLVETSGSTGKPLQFYRDRKMFGYNLAALYRSRLWWEIEIGDKEAMLWGVPVSRLPRLKAKLRDLLLNRFREIEYNINPKTLWDFYRKIVRRKPAYIFGYTSMIHEFSMFLKANQINLKISKLKAVICTAEKLYNNQRNDIIEVFGCPVISEYGATETGIIAHSCPNGSLHINDDCLYIEIVDDNYKPVKDGQTGRVLVTVLNSHSSPIIRYDIGDIASKKETKCSCGVNFSSLNEIEGRISDVIFTPSGKIFHSIIFYYIFKRFTERYGGINQYKIIQTNLSKLEIFLVPQNTFTKKKEVILIEMIREKLGSDLVLEIISCQQIKREKSGKLRDFKTFLDVNENLHRVYSEVCKLS